MHHKANQKPTRLFKFYSVNLVVRLVLLVLAVLAAIFDPVQISITEGFGFAHGITLIDIIFVALVLDMLTKFFSNASIAVGSLKQFRQYHVPTLDLFRINLSSVRDVIHAKAVNQLAMVGKIPDQLRKLWNETKDGALDTIKVLLSDFSLIKKIPIPDELLQANEPVRAQIKAERIREIVPVILFWVVFNVAIGLTLNFFGLLTEPVIIIWMLFFFLFDMICVVLWCPLQLLFMKNRCCTTCQIFNWDAAMTVTPLLIIIWQLPAAWFTWPLVGLSLVVLARWEIAFARHPERFDERTNASLSCVNCQDKLCYIRGSLKRELDAVDLEDLIPVGSFSGSSSGEGESTHAPSH